MKKITTLILLALSVSLLTSWNPDRNLRQSKSVSIAWCGSFDPSLLEDDGAPVLLYDGLGDLHQTISTTNPEAQKYFDQGMRLVYGFNHMEALRSFREASRLDPACAMSYWGQALALGPNINDWNPKDREEMANNAMTMARKLSANASPRERDLIIAMSARYDGKPHDVRDALNNAYAHEMERLADKYKSDVEVLTLLADAFMVGSPWDYWNADGTPKEFTVKARAALEEAIRLAPKHPGAHHLYIHLVEASSKPGDAMKSAGILETAMPAAGHIVHMPSHIYVRVGEYTRSNQSNIAAVKADEGFLSLMSGSGMYHAAYYPHNIDFLFFGALMNGESERCVREANKLVNRMAPAEKILPLYYDLLLTSPQMAAVRYGRWAEVLSAPPVNPAYFTASGFDQFARGIAYIRTHQLAMAGAALHKLDSIAGLDTLKTLYPFFNTSAQIMKVPQLILKGEYQLALSQTEAGLASLRDAAAAEDELRYNEPPDWRIPARHFLGAALLDAGKTDEAIKVYETDLLRNPANGWSLQGLLKAQTKAGRSAEASKTHALFDAAWKAADIKISASRF